MMSESQVNPFELGQQHEREGVPSAKCPWRQYSREHVRYISGRQSVKNAKNKPAQKAWAERAGENVAAD